MQQQLLLRWYAVMAGAWLHACLHGGGWPPRRPRRGATAAASAAAGVAHSALHRAAMSTAPKECNHCEKAFDKTSNCQVTCGRCSNERDALRRLYQRHKKAGQLIIVKAIPDDKAASSCLLAAMWPGVRAQYPAAAAAATGVDAAARAVVVGTAAAARPRARKRPRAAAAGGGPALRPRAAAAAAATAPIDGCSSTDVEWCRHNGYADIKAWLQVARCSPHWAVYQT
jgi:hypothetical protein